ncbi:hypothetical protein BDZ91DRAFT_850200 [Kalaharituber pfeilii]|nr:hypothetical protein BDZ91DRAFT_850200 [Kalaharituber pfeilii]
MAAIANMHYHPHSSHPSAVLYPINTVPTNTITTTTVPTQTTPTMINAHLPQQPYLQPPFSAPSVPTSFMDTRPSFLADPCRVSFMDLTPDGPDFGPSGSLEPAPFPVQIDSDGDMYLVTTSKAFQVSSKILSLASPVFSHLFRNYQSHPHPHLQAPQGPGGPMVVRMDPDDSTELLEVVLNILHFKGRAFIPTFLAPDALFTLGRMCEKYGLGAALRGWTYRWTRQIHWRDKIGLTPCSRNGKIGNGDAVKWLALSWMLRDEGTFKHVSRYVIRNARCADGVGIVYDCGAGLGVKVEGVPAIVLEALAASIEDLHNRMAQTAQQALMAYWNATKPLCKSPIPILRVEIDLGAYPPQMQPPPSPTLKAIACDRLQLAALMHHLKKFGMAPLLSMLGQPVQPHYQQHPPQYSPRPLPNATEARRNTADRVLGTFKNVTENFSKELDGDHRGCSPFPELWEMLRMVDTQGLDLWEIVERGERMICGGDGWNGE